MNQQNQAAILNEIEAYVKNLLDPANVEIKGHDWKHAFRVRSWAVNIATKEQYESLFLVEVAALLHDIGRLKETQLHKPHAAISAQMATEYLTAKQWLSPDEQNKVIIAIANHSKGGDTPLTHILQDADRLDGFGPVGIMRSMQFKWRLPDYDPVDMYHPFTLSKAQIDDFFLNKKEGEFIPYALDFLGYHISWYDRMNTQTGKELGKPLIEYMKQFVEEFKKQIKSPA